MMFHVRPEGYALLQGFNFYPWSERRYSAGFTLVVGDWAWRLRYAPHIRAFYCYTMRKTPDVAAF